MRNVIFQIDTDNHGTVDWYYFDQEKQYHTSWIIKKKDLRLVGKWSAENKKEILNELMESIEIDNQMIKDHNNKKARQRRAGKKL